jgi:hypothetical protein
MFVNYPKSQELIAKTQQPVSHRFHRFTQMNKKIIFVGGPSVLYLAEVAKAPNTNPDHRGDY